uniref:Uncharacterized protein n=1 Tax=Candidatus Kentrum sp. LFY TaxID=2126342 RepID=A0A450UKL2_9GAMM|nr:MAG: hypothetical protein BECKLFY1418B_GA0070995_10419 [Candidatus Kentron sp. LFY]
MNFSDKTKEVIFLIGVFVAMILGMASKVIFDHLTKGTQFEWKLLFIPLLVSPMVYGTVFKFVKGSDETVLMLIFGFQNGFFWQDIFGQLGASEGANNG